jgi:hypothetical protein
MATITNGTKDRSNLIQFSSRLKEGRALALDVWSIYKSVFDFSDSTRSNINLVLPIFQRIASTWGKGI